MISLLSKLRSGFFVALLISLVFGVIFAGQVVAAGAEDKNYTYGMDAYNLGFCKNATGKPPGNTAVTNQDFINRCVFKVSAYCNNFNSELYRNACYGKYFGLGDCRQSGSTSMEQMGVKACKEKNARICDSQPQAAFKTSCQNAGKSQLFGIIIQNANGTTTPAGGGPTEAPATTPAGTGTEASTPAEEDAGLSQAEIEQQAQELKAKLAKGSSDCGDSKTVFDFGCSGTGNSIIQLLFAFVRFATYGVGIIITLSIVISGIQYTSAQGDTNTVTKARMRIFNAVIALLLYVFAFAILNYLVPGGLITG